MNAADHLQSLTPFPLEISWHENKSSYLSFRKERKRIQIRLHRLFERAPPDVLNALANSILKNDRSGRSFVRLWVRSYFSTHRIPSDPLIPLGRTYDLTSIYEKIKKEFFSPEYDAAIGWGRGGKSRFRHITFGTYDRHRHQILIHPLLDDGEVPEYFLAFIVYHEMLHAVVSPQIDGRGYCRCHTREFRQKEKLFPQYVQAKEWEKQSLLFFKRRKYGRS